MTTFAEQKAAELNTLNYSSLVDAFDQSCKDNATKPAFSCLGHELSFAELDRLSAQFAAYLQHGLKLPVGSRIAIQLPNIPQYPIAVWGAWRAGLVVVNTNPMYTAREQLHQFNDSEATALIVLADLLPITEQIIAQTSIKDVIVATAMELFDPSTSYRGEQAISFSEALKMGENHPKAEASLSMNDLAVLQYTGGTTGPSKGAMLSHGNLYSANRFSRQTIILNKPGEPEITIAPLPLYHVFGFTQSVISVVLNGGLSVLIPDPRNLDFMISQMKAYPFTNMAAVNTLLAGLMRHPEFDSIDFSNITGVISGGTTLVKEIADEWHSRTDSVIYEGYGLSETSSSACCNRPESYELGSVGASLNCVEVKTVDDQGNAVPTGERGEVLIRGPHIMQGYWRKPDATAESIDADGWFKTGDIGILQENQHLKIVDRIKDMIIVSGFNVYPNELEAVLYGHPNIVECAVIGVPDASSGEAIKLFVVTNDPQVEEADIISFCRAELTSYKVPKQIVFMDDLPKSPAGKVLRRELRELK